MEVGLSDLATLHLCVYKEHHCLFINMGVSLKSLILKKITKYPKTNLMHRKIRVESRSLVNDNILIHFIAYIWFREAAS